MSMRGTPARYAMATPVARPRQRARASVVHTAQVPCRHHHCLGVERMKLSRPQVPRNHALCTSRLPRAAPRRTIRRRCESPTALSARRAPAISRAPPNLLRSTSGPCDEPGKVVTSIRPSASRLKMTPMCSSATTSSAALWHMTSTALRSDRSPPAAIVSFAWASQQSPDLRAALIPLWAPDE